MRDPRVDELIATLGLEPHPEGGYFREVHRSTRSVRPDDGRPVRAATTTIYYLLPGGDESRWHRVESDEVWHLYEGGLELAVVPPDLSRIDRASAGPVSTATRPVHVVPAGWWQRARPVGGLAFCGCTVAPGFDFADFTMPGPESEVMARLRQLSGEPQ